MRVLTVPNRWPKLKRLAFEGSHVDVPDRIMVRVRPRRNAKAECSGYGASSPTYDTATEPRLF